MNLVTCHIVGPGFVRFRRKVLHQVFQPVLHNVSFSWSFLRLWPTKNFLRWRNKWQTLDARSGLYGGRPIPFSSCILFLPSLKNRHNFLEFSSFFVHSQNTSSICLWISAGRTLLILEILSYSLTLHVIQFSILLCNFEYYNQWVKELSPNFSNTRVLTCFSWHAEDE